MAELPRTSARALVAALTLLPLAASAQTQVVLAGSFQSELGCANDWDPACTATALVYDPADGVWQRGRAGDAQVHGVGHGRSPG